MLRSRRFALAAAALLIGLSACGDSSPRTVAGNGPVVIQLAGSSSAAATEAGTADKMMMPMQDITFVFDGDASKLGDAGAAWTLPVGEKPDAARIQQLADLLGVEGELRELPADQGGGWMIGAADYTTATLTVSADGMLSWWYNPAPATTDVGTVSCVSVDPAIDVVPLDTAGVDPATPATTEASAETTIGGDAVVAPPEDNCDAPLPPANVPDEATALAKAKQLFADMGYDSASYEFETYADDWGANVTAYLLLDGMRSPLSLSVGFGADSAVTWASGSLAAPVPAGEYPLVGADGGVVRLNDDTGQWGGYWGGPMAAMARSEGSGSTEPATDSVTTDLAVAPTDTAGAAPEAVSAVVPCGPETDCGYELPPMEPITVHLTDVKMSLTTVWAADNTIWLLPAYEFSSDDGGIYTVIAVDDSFIQLPTPVPADTLPVETVIVDDTIAVDETVPADSSTVDTAVTTLEGTVEPVLVETPVTNP